MKPIHSIQKGKSGLLFPFCFIVLITHHAAARWQDSFNRLALFNDFNGILYRQIESFEQRFSVIYRYDDIYRKRVFNQRALQIKQEINQYQLAFPIKTAAVDHVFSTVIGFHRQTAGNQHDQTAIRGKGIGEGQTYTFLWARTARNRSGGFYFHSASYHNCVETIIESYPQSEDSRLNRYFLDWLPKTFGSPIECKNRSQHFELTPWLSIPFHNNSNRLRIFLDHSQWNNAFSFRYVNTTNKPTLNGVRVLDIPTQFYSTQLSLLLERSSHFSSAIEVRYSRAGLNYDTDNHPPSFIDFASLGDGSFSLNGGALLFHHIRTNHRLRSGLSVSTFGGEFSIRTPVLGYIYSILPISHQAEGNIRQGHAFSQNFTYSGHFTKKQTRLDLSLDYLHSRVTLRMLGEAELEFGLMAAPIDYPIRLNINLFSLQVGLQHKFGPVALEYRLRQMVPFIKRLDDSPVYLTTEIPGKKVIERGGAVHQLSLSYYF
ncbi:MAG TPA: hypothetical protein ENN20_01060 [Candidatus Marinimicrobia bacterium]|nr:hypothetical protein [Candidatus Neomarinimicrobiota bacterium]